MDSKYCRKVPITLYDGSVVKRKNTEASALSNKYKRDSQKRELIPVKINFMTPSLKPQGEDQLCSKRSEMLKSESTGYFPSEKVEREGCKVSGMSCSSPSDSALQSDLASNKLLNEHKQWADRGGQEIYSGISSGCSWRLVSTFHEQTDNTESQNWVTNCIVNKTASNEISENWQVIDWCLVEIILFLYMIYR